MSSRLVQLYGSSGPVVDPDDILAEHEAARAAYEAGLASMTYTQDSLDAVRVLRNAAELAAWNWACCHYSLTGRNPPPGGSKPTPLPVPGRYPGIAGALTAPTDISGCVLWLTSDAGVTVDAFNNVGAWADQSGSGHDVTYDLGKYQLLPNGFGSLPCLYNDVTQGTLKSSTRILAVGSARTVFVVAKPHFIDDGAIFIDFQPARSTAAKSLAFGIYNKASAGTLHPASDLSAIDEAVSGVTPTDVADVAQIFAYRWQGSGHAVEFAKGGAALAALTGSALTSSTGDDGLTIGHGYGAAHHGPYRGTLGSIIVYDSKLSTNDYDRVCAWLAAKFGV